MITLPMTDILNWATELIADFLPYIAVILGLGIAFWILDKVLHRKD